MHLLMSPIRVPFLLRCRSRAARVTQTTELEMVSMIEDGDLEGKQEDHDDAIPDPLMEVGSSCRFFVNPLFYELLY